MAGDGGRDAAVIRTVVVVAAVMLAIVALRGHLPGAEPAESAAADTPAESAGSLAAVVAMLAVSVAVIAVAVVTQTRRPAAARFDVGALPAARGERGRPPWRLLAIAAAGLLAWLVLVALLMRWGASVEVDNAPGGIDDVPTAPPDADPANPASEPPEPPENPGGGGLFGILAVAAIALFVLSVVATRVGRRRPVAAAPPVTGQPAPPAPPAAPDLARAAELGLAEITDRSRDPREAIIACYAAMERELEKSPGTVPQASDTPSEVLARAVRGRALRADSATELVDLFEEARFSPHVMDEGHRADAERALQLVLDDLEAVR